MLAVIGSDLSFTHVLSYPYRAARTIDAKDVFEIVDSRDPEVV